MSDNNQPGMLDAAAEMLTNAVGAVAEKVEKTGAKVKTRSGNALFVNAEGQPIEVDAVLGLSNLYGVDNTGWPSIDSISFDVERLRGAATSDAVVAREPVTVRLGGAEKLIMDAGAGVVLGKPDSGKSLMANTMAHHNPGLVEVIRFREPEADSLLSERAFVEALYRALYKSDARVVFVDSLRTTFYTSSGPTGKGGVNMAIFTLLTAYDILARRAGKVILFALNPMSTDDVAIDYYLEASRGSVSHTLYATAPKAFRVSSRSNKSRAWLDGKYSPGERFTPGALLPRREGNHLSVESSFRDEFSIVDLYVVSHD